MKSLIITTLIGFYALTLSSISAYGQVESIDILLAPGLTSLRGNSLVKGNLDPRISFSGGLGMNYRLDEQWFISIKFLYEDKGGRNHGPYYYQDGDGNVTQGEAKIRVRFKYLTLPITAGYEFGNKTKFRAEAGPYVAFLMKQILTGDLNDQPQAIQDDTDLDKRADLGLSVGMRALIPITKKVAFNLGVHDNLGLFNISARRVVGDETLKTNFLGLSLGLNFKL
jgi:hypothetical protein